MGQHYQRVRKCLLDVDQSFVTFASIPSSMLPVQVSRHEAKLQDGGDVVFALWETGELSWQEANDRCNMYNATLPSINR